MFSFDGHGVRSVPASGRSRARRPIRDVLGRFACVPTRSPSSISTILFQPPIFPVVNRTDRAIAGFTGLGHSTLHGFELVIPVFVPVWLVAFETTPTTLGIVLGAGYALIGLGSPLAGVLADAYGSKRLVLASIGGMGVAFAALSLVESLVGLALVLLVWGAAASLYHPAGLSLISRGAERRGTVLAFHGVGGNVGMVAYPLAAILLLVFFEWRVVALLLAVPAAFCVVAGLVLPVDGRRVRSPAPVADRPDDSTTAPSKDPETAPSNDPAATNPRAPDKSGIAASLSRFLASSRGLFVGGFVIVFAIQLVYGVYYRGIFTFLPDVLSGLPIFEPVAIGEHEIQAGQFAYSGLLLAGVFGQYAGGVLSDRIRPERALLGTFATLLVLSILFVPASAAGVTPLLVVCALLGFCIYVFAPIGQTLVAEYVPEGRHGLSFGYVYLGTFGVGATGAAIAGAALEFGGIEALFTVLSVLVVGCLALAIGLVVRYGR